MNITDKVAISKIETTTAHSGLKEKILAAIEILKQVPPRTCIKTGLTMWALYDGLESLGRRRIGAERVRLIAEAEDIADKLLQDHSYRLQVISN